MATMSDQKERDVFESQGMLNAVVHSIPSLSEHHACTSPAYAALSLAAKHAVRVLFGEDGPQRGQVGSLGEIQLPFTSMGAIKSTDLFGLDELMLFAFYALKTGKYRRVADIGANIGLHSMILTKLGFAAECFEPDPVHLRLLRRNLAINGLEGRLTIHEAAVSNEAGTVEFCRVLGNTTGSHIVGAKGAPYGELEKFTVPAVDIRQIMRRFDFLKMDVEGHEATLLEATRQEDWQGREAVVEIGTPENARRVFEHLRSIGVNMFAQKIGWSCASSVDQLPTSHREGSVFLSTAAAMEWQ
jgi:FkbM family methyltransferase